MSHREYVEQIAQEVSAGCLSMDQAAVMSREFAVEEVTPIVQFGFNLRAGEINKRSNP